MSTFHPVPRDEVMAFLDGELPAERAAFVRAHLETCEACRALAADLRRVSTRLQDWQVGAPPPSAGLPHAIRDALDVRAASRAGGWLAFPAWLTMPRFGLAVATAAGVAIVVLVARPGGPLSPGAPGTRPAAPEAELADARQLDAPPDQAGRMGQALRDETGRGAEPASAALAREERAAEKPVEAGATLPAPDPRRLVMSDAARLRGRGAGVMLPDAPPRPARSAEAPPPPAAPAPPPAPASSTPASNLRVAQAEAQAGAGGRGAAAADSVLAFRASIEGQARAVTLSLTADRAAPADVRQRIVALAAELDARLRPAPAGPSGFARAGTAPGDLVLLVPVEGVESLIQSLASLGDVSGLSRTVENIGPAIADVQARQAEARQDAARLAARLASLPAGSREAAAVARQLADAQAEVARVEAEARDLDERQRLVVVTVRLRGPVTD